ncbi:MAG: hypothetical protein KAR40_17940 [Candidatus Sabulitectum sp.]|nr:hypothetical protein [Candidatus Sabulitectum sp.]
MAGFLFFIVSKSNSNYILFLIFWLYISNFYGGQGWITNSAVAKLINARYYIFFVFIVYFNKLSTRNSFDNNMLIWTVIYLILIIFRDIVVSHTFGLGILIIPYYVYVYYIIQLPSNTAFNNNLFNLLIAIGILQLIVSVMQVNGIIPPPIATPSGLYAGFALVKSGIDDAAVGTMGSIASNQTSWLGTILFLFLGTIGFLKNSNRISMFSLLFLVQYSTVDSKTLLGTTIVAFVLLLIKLNIFNILFSRRVFTLLLILAFGLLMHNRINAYYMQFNTVGVEAPKENIFSSVQNIISNFNEWGKIKGFATLYNDFISQSGLTLLIGDNISIFDANSSVLLADVSIMSSNNLTNSISAWISLFARGGLLGLGLIIWFYYLLFSALRKRKYFSTIGYCFSKSGQIMLVSSILTMFIYYGVTFGDLPFTLIIMLFALVVRIEKEVAPSKILSVISSRAQT